MCIGNFITVKPNGQGRANGRLNFPVHDPSLTPGPGVTTKVWVTVTVDGGLKVLHSPAVTMVIPEHDHPNN